MVQLHQELSTLARCVKYQNLSQAAAHVGLSQPQLSRVISRIEGEMGITLLDRSARKKSAWTPMAFKLAETYSSGIERLDGDLNALLDSGAMTHLNVATLEGMIPVAAKVLNQLMISEAIHSIDVKVLDLSELELGFGKGDFDLIFTNREPGRKKFHRIKKVGYQTLDMLENNDLYKVYSSFEYSTLGTRQRKKVSEPTVISNSLLFRKHWLEEFGGSGLMPSEIYKKKPAGSGVESVFVIGTDSIPEKVWSQVTQYS